MVGLELDGRVDTHGLEDICFREGSQAQVETTKRNCIFSPVLVRASEKLDTPAFNSLVTPLSRENTKHLTVSICRYKWFFACREAVTFKMDVRWHADQILCFNLTLCKNEYLSTSL
jgi:hypothetical protein